MQQKIIRINMTAHQYWNPPIVEAVCELGFSSATPWNISYPWLFHEKIKHIYTGLPQEQKIVGLEQTSQVDPTIERSPFTVVEQSKIQFPLEDGTGLIAVGPNIMSSHVYKPYKGWNVFRARFEEALGEYIKVANPDGVRRIGLRYINQLIIPGSKIDVASYFTIPPVELTDDCAIDNFLCRNEYIYKDEPIRAILNFARGDAPEGTSAYLLDIDMVWQWPAEALPLDSVMNKIDELRRRERVIFEHLITDKARELFDAER